MTLKHTWIAGAALSLVAAGAGLGAANLGAQERVPAARGGARTAHGDPPDPVNVSPELTRIYEHIDANYDKHLDRLKKWTRIPSVSNTVEGKPAIWESAKFIRDVIVNELGCKADIYDPGVADWGAPGHPVVYGRCDVGASKTLIDYSMGDVMPIFRPELWQYPPFGAQIVERPPFKKVMVARAAYNHKGRDMAELSALISIKAVTGTLPVNIIFVSEHDEERMDLGLRKFMFDRPELFKDADAAFVHGSTQLADGRGVISGQSIGCVVFDLETSSPPVGLWLNEQPMWRHFKMLTTVFDDNSALIKELSKSVTPPSAEEVAYLKREAQTTGGSFDALMKARSEIRVTITGTWGGNMAPGYAGNYRPPAAWSKIDIRFPPPVDGNEVLKQVRAHLDRSGYKDVAMKTVGVVPWSYTNGETEIAQAVLKMFKQFNVSYNPPPKGDFLGANATYYGPNYLFAREPLRIPVIMAGLGGYGERAHTDNEWVVIEGDGQKHYGYAGAMKGFATILYNYAGKGDRPRTSSPNVGHR